MDVIETNIHFSGKKNTALHFVPVAASFRLFKCSTLDSRMFLLVPAKQGYLESGSPKPCQAEESNSCVQNIYYRGIKPYSLSSIVTGADLSPNCSSIRKSCMTLTKSEFSGS